GEMNRSTHLLIEECVPGTAIYIAVIAEGKFTQPTCPFIYRKHLLEIVLSLRSTCLNDDPVLETQSHIFYGATSQRSRAAIANIAIGRILKRACKEFPIRQIEMAVRVDEDAP